MSQPWTHTAAKPAYPRVDEHYVEPSWVSERLFEEEKFDGPIYDPACGFGRIIKSAQKAGLYATGTDIIDRGWPAMPWDFMQDWTRRENIVSNPPFDVFQAFAEHALTVYQKKLALIMPTARLNAARWLQLMSLRRVWLLTPRPSMPPGHVIASGGKVGGGKSDYCWLVFEHGYRGGPELKWLRRTRI